MSNPASYNFGCFLWGVAVANFAIAFIGRWTAPDDVYRDISFMALGTLQAGVAHYLKRNQPF